jgi:hypothetical protein
VLTGHVKQTKASEEQVVQPIGQLKQDVAVFPAGLAWFGGQAEQIFQFRKVLTGHVKQAKASEEQVVQPIGQLKQYLFAFPARLAWFGAQAEQLPLLRYV